MLTSREKSPLPEDQMRVEPATLHHARQQARPTLPIIELSRPPPLRQAHYNDNDNDDNNNNNNNSNNRIQRRNSRFVQSQTLLKMWRPRFRIKKAFPQTSSVLSLLASSWRMAALWLHIPEGVHSPLGAASPWWLLTFVCFSFLWTHFFSNTDYFCALL